MSVEVGTAYVTLVPSLKGFSAKAEREIGRSGIGSAVQRTTTRAATQAGTKSGGLFSRAFNRSTRNSGLPRVFEASFLRNVRTYGYALSAITGLTVGLGLKTASSFQQAKIAFTTTLGSARKAKVLFGQLVQFAKKTPFDLPGVVTASQKLLAFGFRAGQVKSTLTSLGDAAAGLSLGTDGLDRLTTAIGQISAKGKLQSDELLQLTETGVPALRILANEFGLTTGALQDMVQHGLVPADKAIPALLHGLETGTKGIAGRTAAFGGLMRKQARTLGGLFSNLKDALTIGLARAVKPLVPVLERALPGAIKAVSRAMRAASRYMAEFLHGLGVAKDRTKGSTTAFESLGHAVRTTAHVLSVVGHFVGRNAHLFLMLGGALLGGIVALKAFNAVMAITDAVMTANPIGLVVFALGALAVGFAYAWHKSETFRDIMTKVFHGLEQAVGTFVQLHVLGLKLILDTWLSVVGSVIHLAASMFGWVPGVGGKLKSAAKAFDGFKDHVDSTLSDIANSASTWGEISGSNWGAGWQRGVNGQGTGANSPFRDPGHVGYVAPVVKGAKDAGDKAKPVFHAVGSSLGGALADGVKDGGSKAADATQSLIDKLLAPLRTLRQKAAQLASQIVQAVTGDSGFGALADRTDSLGAAFGSSVHSIIAGLTGQRDDVRKFRHRLRVLKRRGLSKAAAREIAGEGVAEGGKVADALLGASGRQLKHISALRAQTKHAAHGLGNDVARDKYGARIVRELNRTRHAIEKAADDTDLSDKTIHRLERAYKRAAKSVQPYVDIREHDHRQGKRVRQHS